MSTRFFLLNSSKAPFHLSNGKELKDDRTFTSKTSPNRLPFEKKARHRDTQYRAFHFPPNLSSLTGGCG
jgi:hypothetical protein